VSSAVEITMREPVTVEQVAAATRIHDRYMPAWAAADRALDRLREALPGFDESAVLVKAAAVDRLYYSRHQRLPAAVKRIVAVMANPPEDPTSIVEQIAPLNRSRGTTRYWSFASKFVHFFVDPVGTPIYDDWAVRTIRHHFGRLSWQASTPYGAFARYVQVLRTQCGLTCSARELDRYLWLSGMLRAWQARPEEEISREVRALFASDDREAQAELEALLGQRTL
jgi:hypothetical protein